MSFRSRARCAGLVAAGILTLSAFAAHAADDAFVERAGQGGAAEIAAGTLARTRGAGEGVKAFGAQMVTDHTRVGEELKTVAGTKSMNVPAQPSAKQLAALKKLEEKSGADFDKAFKARMIQDHQETIGLFEKEAKSGKDADLKAFAAKALPDLRHHLEMAKALK